MFFKGKEKMSVRKSLIKAYCRIQYLFNPIKKQMLFLSFNGKQYSDSPKAISEFYHNNFPEYSLVWGVQKGIDKSIFPSYVKLVEVSTFSFYKELAKSSCFVTNGGIPIGFPKRKKQFFVDTWHGDRPLKKILYDATGVSRIEVDDSKLADFCLAGSIFGENVYRTAFKYSGMVINVGIPRNDILFSKNASLSKAIKERIGIKDSAKILLYAPTFRDGESGHQKTLINLEEIINHLKSKGDDWVCLVRGHSSSNGLDIQCDGKTLIDSTKYPDMAELLFVCDILITDYSSSASDFILTKRPTILALFDINEYESKSRQLYYNPKEAGFIVAYSQSELIQLIDNLNEATVIESCQKLFNFYGIKESGQSTSYICRLMHAKQSAIFKGENVYGNKK